jgi:hypothetical protein
MMMGAPPLRGFVALGGACEAVMAMRAARLRLMHKSTVHFFLLAIFFEFASAAFRVLAPAGLPTFFGNLVHLLAGYGSRCDASQSRCGFRVGAGSAAVGVAGVRQPNVGSRSSVHPSSRIAHSGHSVAGAMRPRWNRGWSGVGTGVSRRVGRR